MKDFNEFKSILMKKIKEIISKNTVDGKVTETTAYLTFIDVLEEYHIWNNK
ncbi:MAG: hypothetical protein KH328_01500 [Staphylococcus sp.]|nr:hypothetical protein [Staphylococcus sp.]